MKKAYKISVFLFISALILCLGCKKKEDTPKYDVPTTYNFTNVNYQNPVIRLKMFAALETALNNGRTSVLNAQTLKNMFTNTGSPFGNDSLDNSGLQLKDQNQVDAQSILESYLDSVAVASQSYTITASNGQAGVAVSTTDATRKYLLAANGFNYQQLFSKSMMGSLILYQIVNNYLSTGIATGVDNTTVVTGQGTAMEHAWDQAFGYFDVPVDFPTNLTGVKYYGSYCNQVDTGMHSNTTLMNAFLKGRAAISNKDMTTKDAQAAIIIATFERMAAACAIHELNEAKQDLTNTPKVNTNVSESMGFVLSMRYNPKRVTISDAQINTILGYYGNNLYNLTQADIENIINTLSSIYGFDSVKAFI